MKCIHHCFLFQRLTIAASLIGASSLALAATDPIEMDLGFGKINAMVGASTDELQASFTVTKKGADNKTLTLQQLEKMLGQDHVNWFQKVTKVDPAIMGLKVPFIDPMKGGQGPLWADDRPWYWDEVSPPKPLPMGKTSPPTFIPPMGKTELGVQSHDGAGPLEYSDSPGGQPVGTKIDFATYLVSDYGNKTYDVLGKGFTWQTTIGAGNVGKISDITKNVDFMKDFQDEIKNDFGWLRTKGPDSSQSTDASPTWVAKEKGPAGGLINVQPTNGGKRIENADGSIVQLSQSVPAGNNSVNFRIPGIINGKKVTDATQQTGKGRDPGTLSFSVFDDSEMMTQDSLSSWLMSHSYNSEDTGLFMPDFFPDPSSGVNEVFYGADMHDLLDAGRSFVNSTAFDQTLSVGSLSAMLPGYVFSSTPLDYVPGQGWVGTPLDPGMQLSYVAYHDVYAVPEPAAFLLAVLSVFGAAGLRRRHAT